MHAAVQAPESCVRIGILSDTHSNIPRTCHAIDLLLTRGVHAILHCGDIGCEDTLLEMTTRCEAHSIPFYAVLGNVDEPEGWTWRLCGNMSIPLLLRIAFGAKQAVVLHGHRELELARAIGSGEFDYVFTGHTHMPRDERVGRTRVINPGAVHRAARPTVAVLDLDADSLAFMTLDA